MPAIAIRPLTIAELPRVSEIDVTESGTLVYQQAGRHVMGTREEWCRPRRSAADWSAAIEAWQRLLAQGGVAVGAFEGETLVGIAVLRPRLTARLAQLAALFVSRDRRRCGVATRLTDEIARQARESGALALYVSATPSESAVGFYTSQGFRPTKYIIEELYELEPEDIHMIKPL
jgi:GNAT superfamily N-acetyltransferase